MSEASAIAFFAMQTPVSFLSQQEASLSDVFFFFQSHNLFSTITLPSLPDLVYAAFELTL